VRVATIARSKMLRISPLASGAGLLLLAACSSTSPAGAYGADSLDRIDKRDGGTPIYSAMGKLDYAGENPDSRATRVMTAACPRGHPRLLGSTAQPIATDTFNGSIFLAMFTCDTPIPGAD
jgi:hypothetical protein